MKRIKNFTLKILGATILSLGLYACNNDDTTPVVVENKIEETIKGKWFYYGEEELDANGKIEAFWDLSEKECNSGYIVLKSGNIKEEQHSDVDEDCEKYDYPGTWSYEKTSNTLTFIDEEDGYIVKGKIIIANTNELRIKLTQQGDDTDFEDWNTHLVFKKSL